MGLSACGYHRVMNVARIIADLAGVTTVAKPHTAEALFYLRLTRVMCAGGQRSEVKL